MPASIITLTVNPAIDLTVQVDRFVPAVVNRAAHVTRHAGGKGINVATALAGLGESVIATGFLGRDNSAIFEAHLQLHRIADRMIRLAGETRTGIKIVDGAAQQVTDINLPGLAPTAADCVALRETLPQSLGPGCWLAVCGSLPPGVSPSWYAHIVAAARQGGAAVAVDTSGPALTAAVAERPAVIKPNRAELEELLGRPLPDLPAIHHAACELVAIGIGLVVVSLGGEGALFVSADEAIHAMPPRVEVATTVGAGDALLAGVIHGRSRHRPLEDIARLSTALGTLAVLRVGAGGAASAERAEMMARIAVVRIGR